MQHQRMSANDEHDVRSNARAEQFVKEYLKQVRAAPQRIAFGVKPLETEAGRAIAEAEPAMQVAVIRHAVRLSLGKMIGARVSLLDAG